MSEHRREKRELSSSKSKKKKRKQQPKKQVRVRNARYPYPIEIPAPACRLQKMQTGLDLGCELDGRCSRDEITIYQTPPPVVEYEFGNLALPVAGTLFLQKHPECPIKQSFTEKGEDEFNIAGDYIHNFNEEDCSFEIFTEDPGLAEAIIPLRMEFEPMYGGLGDAYDFELAILSGCADEDPTPVVFPVDRVSVSLWTDLQVPFEMSGSGNACGRTEYEMVAPQITAFEADFAEGLVFGTPTDRVNEPGVYSVAIATNLHMDDGSVRSAVSDEIRIAVTDPCPFSSILSNPVPNLAADIGGFDQKNLRNYDWPWADHVDLESGRFGTDKCGLKDYYVTDDLDDPVPFVVFRPDGSLVMEPVDGRDVPGRYTCKLHAHMVEFPDIHEAERFACDIPACTPHILPNGARGPTKISTYWGSPVATFDVSDELARFTVEPSCGQELEFRAVVLDEFGTPGPFREVDCSDLVTCYVEKCNGGSSTAGDSECEGWDGLPYDVHFTVIIQAVLQDGTVDETITFPVEILDPCINDELEFRPGIQSFQYTLTTPETIITRVPTIVQTNAGLCPVKCVLRDAAGD